MRVRNILMDDKWLLTASEDELKEFLIERLGSFFEHKPEVPGNFLVDSTPVKIDYLFYPKEDLINKGFPDKWFGVEVKSLGTKHEARVKKCLSACWQCITYRWCDFGGVRPYFILLFPNIKKFFLEREDTGASPRYISALMQRGNVGEIYFGENQWEFRFGSQYFYRSDKGLGNVKNLGTKKHVGTKK